MTQRTRLRSLARPQARVCHAQGVTHPHIGLKGATELSKSNETAERRPKKLDAPKPRGIYLIFYGKIANHRSIGNAPIRCQGFVSNCEPSAFPKLRSISS